MDDETFMLLVREFKKERKRLNQKEQQVLGKLQAARKFQSSLAYFKEMIDLQDETLILTRDILGQFIDLIALYPANRSVRPYQQRIEIYYKFIGKLGLNKLQK